MRDIYAALYLQISHGYSPTQNIAGFQATLGGSDLIRYWQPDGASHCRCPDIRYQPFLFCCGSCRYFRCGTRPVVQLDGGVLIDSCDRKKIILFTSCILTLVALTFAYQAWAGTGSVALLYLLTSLQSALMAIDGPARRSVIARLLPSDQIPAASSLLQLSFQVSLLTGQWWAASSLPGRASASPI